MLIVKEDKTRKYEEGQIFVELTKNRGLSITNCDRLGYWCDKAHLKHFILELSKVMTDSDLFRLLGDRLKITNKKTPHTCPICGGNGIVPNGFYSSTTGIWSIVSTTPEKCKSCNGTGIVWN